MTQVSPSGGFLGSAYNDGSDENFEQSGVPIRVENIRSLADYDTVLTMLRRLDANVMTESLETDAMVFRATDQSAAIVRDSLIASRSFEALNTDQVVGELSFRYLAR